MTDYFIEIAGPTLGPILGIAIAIIAIAIAIWLVLLLVRQFRSGLFVSGSAKGRLPRLAITDAVPVDSNRRLILVRRDDVEHLIMIGGPSDLIVETGIGKPQQSIAPVLPRLPTQSAQSQTVQPQMPPQIRPPQAAQPQPSQSPAAQPRPAIVAAREAVADAERGRAVRLPEAQLAERRSEPATILHTQVAPAVQPQMPTSALPQVPSTNSVGPAALPRSTAELDLDKLLEELRPNPRQDR